uniref:Uncharacterized protein n=1 Tax=Arundo donax TaxID=35708 RepID=A0A0A9C122_ARUDO
MQLSCISHPVHKPVACNPSHLSSCSPHCALLSSPSQPPSFAAVLVAGDGRQVRPLRELGTRLEQ